MGDSTRRFQGTTDKVVGMTTGNLSLDLRLFLFNPGSSEKGIHMREPRFALWDVTSET